MRRATHAAFLLACVALAGCDKLKGAVGKADDAGSAPSSGGSGVLSFLGTDFEGEITANVTSRGKPQAGGPQQLVFGIKKPKVRIDAVGGPANAMGGAILVDPPTKKGWVLVPTQKMAMVIDFDKAKSMKGTIPGLPNAPKGMPTSVPKTPPTIDKTGKKDVVAGYSCDVWDVTSEGKRSSMCVAEGITWVDISDLGMASPELAAAAFATDANRFPLRVVSFDAKGAEDLRMEATKIEKKTLDASRFVVPPDYRVVDMASMMGGLLPPKGLPAPQRP